MTTPSKAEKRRPLAFEVKSDGYFDTYEAYDKCEADALFESLEQELGDTKRALDIAAREAGYFTSGIERLLNRVRQERAALPEPPTVAEEGK